MALLSGQPVGFVDGVTGLKFIFCVQVAQPFVSLFDRVYLAVWPSYRRESEYPQICTPCVSGEMLCGI